MALIEHSYEEHPHIHAYILPLDGPACAARDMKPSWVAKIAAEEAARAEGEPDKIAVREPATNDISMEGLLFKARGEILIDNHQIGICGNVAVCS